MSEVQPQPGDKVIIRYRPREIHATVDRDGLYPGMDDVEDGRADVEIVEHADPSGTVRGDRYICLESGKLYGWWDFRMSEWALASDARKEPVTGAVPGTPAAQAQAEAAGLPGNARLAEMRAQLNQCDCPGSGTMTHVRGCGLHPGGAKAAPLVVQYGDPEPDTRRTYRSSNGITVEMGTFGWRVVGTNGDTLINVPWSAVPERCFPMTEVVEPKTFLDGWR